MPYYLVQVGYESEAIAGLVKSPQDRTAAVRVALEAVGGRLVSDLYMCFGEYDAVGIFEVPDNTSAVALSMAFTGTGRYRSFHTTPLLTMQEGEQAMRTAGRVNVRPAGS